MGVGLTRPKARVAGIDAAGVVEAAGANVRGLVNGGDVLGFFRGAFAEYACAAADLVVPKPAGLTFEQAAAVPIAATTALRGIRDVGEVTAGQRVLVNGAGGGVGSYAVQIAAALGAEVTGVCRTRNAGLVCSIGAAHVIDYTTGDFTGGRARYEVILDNVSSLPLSRLRRALTPKGILVLSGGGSPGHVFGPVAGIVRAVVANAFVSQRLRPLPSRQNREELLAVTRLIEGMCGRREAPAAIRPRAERPDLCVIKVRAGTTACRADKAGTGAYCHCASPTHCDRHQQCCADVARDAAGPAARIPRAGTSGPSPAILVERRMEVSPRAAVQQHQHPEEGERP
jgi:hypothetical protein